ncbi:MAG: hypothetical protein QXK24_02165 [Ignisphaera sp.]
MSEFKAKKAKAIQNFKNSVMATFDASWRLAYFSKDNNVYVLTAEDVLKHMEQETDVGKELILMWSVDVNKELERLGVKPK